MKKVLSTKQKTYTVILSVFLTFVMLETVLRVGGFLVLKYQQFQNHRAAARKDIQTIMCIGESTTFLGGDDSYPSQLENVINELAGDKEFRVINQGVPGIGSGYIAAHLEQWIREHHPDIVVAMIGINDHNPLIPFIQAKKEGAWPSFYKNLRVVKLVRLIKANIANRFKETGSGTTDTIDLKNEEGMTDELLFQYITARKIDKKGFHAQAELLYKRLLQSDIGPRSRKILTQDLGTNYREQGKYNQYTGIILKKLDNPQDPWASEQIELSCRTGNAAKEVTQMLKAMIKAQPETDPFYDLLAGCYEQFGDKKQADFYLQKAQDIRADRYNPTTKQSYQRIVNILNRHQIKMVFVQYPLRSLASLERMLDFYDRDNFVLVDNEEDFQEVLKESSYEAIFKDRFAGSFGHCTREGNVIIAKNIAEAILTEIY